MLFLGRLFFLVTVLVSCCVTQNATEVTILNAFKATYPQDSFVVMKGAYNWRGRYIGTGLLYVKLSDEEYLFVGKLSASSGAQMSKTDVKSRAFPSVLNTKHITDPSTRCFKVHDELKPIFPNHNVYVMVANSTWRRQIHNIKGEVIFKRQYGTDVDIILN